MTALWHELRVLFAEWLFARAVQVMPTEACEREPLEQAHRIYCSDVAPYHRAVKWPA